MSIFCVCRSRIRWLNGALLLLLLAACNERHTPPEAEDERVPPPDALSGAELDVRHANEVLWSNLRRNVADTLKLARDFEAKVNEFLAAPSETTLAAAQAHWLRLALQEPRLTLLGGISEQRVHSEAALNSLLYRLFAAPIQPGFLDRFGEYEYSGLVFDIGFRLSAESLLDQQGLTDETEVVLGIYAIEFMLFGENGKRSAVDYQPRTTLNDEDRKLGLESVEELPKNRRRTLLSLQVEQLLRDIQQLKSQTESDGVAARWSNLSAPQQVKIMREAVAAKLTQSLIDLAELQNALNEHDAQELPVSPSALQLMVKKLATRFEALLPALSFYTDVESAAMQQHLQESVSALKSLQIDKNAAETNRTTLSGIYNRIKTLVGA